MIYTFTLNPSIDHYVVTDGYIKENNTNRAEKTYTVCGGKGINVSLACNALGIKTVCCGIYGGFTGDKLLSELDKSGIEHRFVKVKADTRINTKLLNNGKVTEINAPAPNLDGEEVKSVISLFDVLKPGDTAVLSGSVPGTDGLLSGILDKIKEKNAAFIADTSGKAFEKCIEYKPYLVKPNRAEISSYFGCDIKPEQIPVYAEKLIRKGVKYALVSDGENGAYLADENEVRYLPVNDVGLTAKNATGAGDSMIAGYLYGIEKGLDALVCAVSAGSAAAYSELLFDKSLFDVVIKSYTAV